MKFAVSLMVCLGLGLMSACQNAVPAPKTATRALGMLEVEFDFKQKLSRAAFLPTGAIRPQSILNETDFIFTSNSFQVVQTATRRYLNARFDIRNASAATVNNLTLVAYVKAGNQSDTAFKNIQNFAGGALDLGVFAQAIQPAHGLNNDASINSNLADLMLFDETETAALQTQAASFLQAGEYLLPYGYVARNGTNGRSIEANAIPTGSINIGLNLPNTNEPSSAAYRFSMTFAVFENPTTNIRVVESLEEQSSNATVTTRVTETSATEVAILPGSSYPTRGTSLKVLCDVRIAGAAAPIVVLGASQALDVGQVTNLAGVNTATVCLKPTGNAATPEFVAIPANLASTGSSQSLSITSAGTVAALGAFSSSNLTQQGSTPQTLLGLGETTQTLQETRPAHEDLSHLLLDPAAKVSNKSSRQGRSIPSGVPAVGSTMTLNVASGCTGALDERTGTVRVVTDHLIVVSDDANPPGGFDLTQYTNIATTGSTLENQATYGFEGDVYAAIVNAFGTPADIDNNERIIAFFTKAVNELSPPASSTIVSGYFDRRDLLNTTACPRSNQGEILYMLVPDPTGAVNSNVRTVSLVNGNVPRTLGAEFARLINASRRTYITSSTSLEERWLEDGLSTIAEELIFYQNSVGLAPRSNIVLNTLTTGPNASLRVAAFNTFANSNYGRLRTFLERPDIRNLYTVSDTTNGVGGLGAIWSFLRYTVDRKNGDANSFWASLVDSNLVGRANLQNAIGASNDLDTWIRDWLGSLFADDFATNFGTSYQSTSWNFRSVFSGLGGYPILIRTLSNNVTSTLSYGLAGSSHYKFGIATNTAASLLLRSNTNAPSTHTALTLMRVR
jgi:hypothetical protein